MANKVAIITGASSGIGKSAAYIFAKNGYNLAICCNKNSEGLAQTAKELRALGSQVLEFILDAGDYEKVSEMIKTTAASLGRIDVLVNNAGISYVGLLQDMSYEKWQEIINSNLTSVFNTCKNTIPYMLKEKSGKIINVSSMWGLCGSSCEVAYSASKGGVNAFTKALAQELAPSNISVNAVAFGCIDTRMNSCFTDEEKASLAEEIPAGRFASAEEAANYIFNLSQENSYLTGQVITYDGGFV